MAIFSSHNKIQKNIDKLKNREFENIKEKLGIISELEASLEEGKLREEDIVWMVLEPDTHIRNFGTNYVVRNYNKRIFKNLVSELAKTDYKAYQYFVDIVVKVKPPEIKSYLRKSISSAENKIRDIAVKIASKLPGLDNYYEIFEEALRDPVENIRYQAICKFCDYIKQDRVFNLLRTLIFENSDKIRHKIIKTMAHLDKIELVDPFFERLPLEPRKIQEYITEALTRIAIKNEKEIEGKLIRILADESLTSREAAVRLLAKLTNKKRLIRKFLYYTRGVAPWLRDRIFETIGLISKDIVKEVREIVEDENDNLRIDAMLLAGYIQHKSLIPGVQKILDSDLDWWVRISALDIIIKLEPNNLSDILKKYRYDNDLKWSIISAYKNYIDTSAVDYLKECIYDKSRLVKLEALRAISSYKSPDIIDYIKEFYETNKEWTLKIELEKIFRENNIKIASTQVKKKNKSEELEELKNLGIELLEYEDKMDTLTPEDRFEKLYQEIEEEMDRVGNEDLQNPEENQTEDQEQNSEDNQVIEDNQATEEQEQNLEENQLTEENQVIEEQEDNQATEEQEQNLEENQSTEDNQVTEEQEQNLEENQVINKQGQDSEEKQVTEEQEQKSKEKGKLLESFREKIKTGNIKFNEVKQTEKDKKKEAPTTKKRKVTVHFGMKNKFKPQKCGKK